MRKINPNSFNLARRSTTREINRRIALNLIREHQAISRADLARRMQITRGFAGVLVNELITEGLIYEGVTGKVTCGRKPVPLYIRTKDRLVIAADVRYSRTNVMLCDFAGNKIVMDALDPVASPELFIRQFAAHVRTLVDRHSSVGRCEGIGVVIPGMVDRDAGRVINAPPLRWRDVDIATPLADATGLPVVVESAGKACALAEMWLGSESDDVPENYDFVYVSVSDGVGAGVVVGGELIRGNHQMAGEFGHMQLSQDGPTCACGANGCWMAYVSNLATISRYQRLETPHSRQDLHNLSVADIIQLARDGDLSATTTIHTTARYLGLGLVTIIHALDPARIFIGGEITAGWDLIEPIMRAALAERALTDEAFSSVIQPSRMGHPRLRGAAALFAAPTFAAPQVA